MQRRYPIPSFVNQQRIEEERNAARVARLRYLQREYNQLQGRSLTDQEIESLQRIMGEMHNLDPNWDPILRYQLSQEVVRQILDESIWPRRGYNRDQLKSILIRFGIWYPPNAPKHQLVDILKQYF
jgi:hypothetical protein